MWIYIVRAQDLPTNGGLASGMSSNDSVNVDTNIHSTRQFFVPRFTLTCFPPFPSREYCLSSESRAIEIQPRSSSRALVRRAQANEELGRFGLCIDDLEAAEALILGGAQEVHPRGESKEMEIALAEELEDIRKRLERARWIKVSRYMDIKVSPYESDPYKG